MHPWLLFEGGLHLGDFYTRKPWTQFETWPLLTILNNVPLASVPRRLVFGEASIQGNTILLSSITLQQMWRYQLMHYHSASVKYSCNTRERNWNPYLCIYSSGHKKVPVPFALNAVCVCILLHLHWRSVCVAFVLHSVALLFRCISVCILMHLCSNTLGFRCIWFRLRSFFCAQNCIQ